MAEDTQQGARSSAPHRQVTRDLIDLETALIPDGEHEIMVRLVDLSRKGFHARLDGPRFERGDVVALRLPVVGLLPARVMWGLDGCFGGQFSQPISEPDYLALLAQIRADTPHDPVSAAG